jgi:hypothetical protein
LFFSENLTSSIEKELDERFAPYDDVEEFNMTNKKPLSKGKNRLAVMTARKIASRHTQNQAFPPYKIKRERQRSIPSLRL